MDEIHLTILPRAILPFSFTFRAPHRIAPSLRSATSHPCHPTPVPAHANHTLQTRTHPLPILSLSHRLASIAPHPLSRTPDATVAPSPPSPSLSRSIAPLLSLLSLRGNHALPLHVASVHHPTAIAAHLPLAPSRQPRRRRRPDATLSPPTLCHRASTIHCLRAPRSRSAASPGHQRRRPSLLRRKLLRQPPPRPSPTSPISSAPPTPDRRHRHASPISSDNLTTLPPSPPRHSPTSPISSTLLTPDRRHRHTSLISSDNATTLPPPPPQVPPLPIHTHAAVPPLPNDTEEVPASLLARYLA